MRLQQTMTPKKLFFIVALTITVVSLVLINNEYQLKSLTDSQDSPSNIVDKPNDDSSVYTEIIDARIFRMSIKCPQVQEEMKSRLQKGGKLALYFNSEKYNLTSCNVGKGGGTFMKLFFTILSDGEAKSRYLENRSRFDMHSQTRKELLSRDSDWKNKRILAISRDPYSRLFSAYTDRVFLPSPTGAIRNGSKCRYDVTFGEFVQIVTDKHFEKNMDPHWSPIYNTCKPCNVMPTYIVRLESFTKDIQYVMKDVKLDTNKTNAVNRLLTETRTRWTITGIVKTVMEKMSRQFLQPNCIGWHGIVKRLWKAFQIQGYIDDKVEFPEYKYKGNETYSNVSFFLETVFDTIEAHPLSKVASKTQRRRALVTAYKEINETLTRKLQRMYYPDFEIFGYSQEIPK